MGLASLGETTNIGRLDTRQRVENDTLCRNRHGGLALDAVQSRASTSAAVRGNQVDLAAEPGADLGRPDPGGERASGQDGPAGLTRKRRSNENVQVAQVQQVTDRPAVNYPGTG